MSEQLRELIVDTQAAFKEDADKAKATFGSSSSLQTGFQSRVSIREHGLTVDEPQALGGTDTGPNPVELILAALGTCQEITYRAYATVMGVPLDNVSVELEGDIDLRGFFAVDESVRAGYQAIRGTVHIADAGVAATSPITAASEAITHAFVSLAALIMLQLSQGRISTDGRGIA